LVPHEQIDRLALPASQEAPTHREWWSSLSAGFPAAMCEKRVDRPFGFSGQKTARHFLRAIDHLIDGSDPKIVSVQLNDDVPSPLQTHRFAQFGGKAYSAGFRNFGVN
jgi:hypothetical protein